MAQLFVLAVKRDSHRDIPDNWIESIVQIDGVQQIFPHADESVIVVRATERAIQEIEGRLGRYLHVERTIGHAAAF